MTTSRKATAFSWPPWGRRRFSLQRDEAASPIMAIVSTLAARTSNELSESISANGSIPLTLGATSSIAQANPASHPRRPARPRRPFRVAMRRVRRAWLDIVTCVCPHDGERDRTRPMLGEHRSGDRLIGREIVAQSLQAQLVVAGERIDKLLLGNRLVGDPVPAHSPSTRSPQ